MNGPGRMFFGLLETTCALETPPSLLTGLRTGLVAAQRAATVHVLTAAP